MISKNVESAVIEIYISKTYSAQKREKKKLHGVSWKAHQDGHFCLIFGKMKNDLPGG